MLTDNSYISPLCRNILWFQLGTKVLYKGFNLELFRPSNFNFKKFNSSKFKLNHVWLIRVTDFLILLLLFMYFFNLLWLISIFFLVDFVWGSKIVLTTHIYQIIIKSKFWNKIFTKFFVSIHTPKHFEKFEFYVIFQQFVKFSSNLDNF